MSAARDERPGARTATEHLRQSAGAQRSRTVLGSTTAPRGEEVRRYFAGRPTAPFRHRVLPGVAQRLRMLGRAFRRPVRSGRTTVR